MTTKQLLRRVRTAFIALSLALLGFLAAETAVGGAARATVACGGAENPCALPALIVTAQRAAPMHLAGADAAAPATDAAQS